MATTCVALPVEAERRRRGPMMGVCGGEEDTVAIGAADNCAVDMARTACGGDTDRRCSRCGGGTIGVLEPFRNVAQLAKDPLERDAVMASCGGSCGCATGGCCACVGASFGGGCIQASGVVCCPLAWASIHFREPDSEAVIPALPESQPAICCEPDPGSLCCAGTIVVRMLLFTLLRTIDGDLGDVAPAGKCRDSNDLGDARVKSRCTVSRDLADSSERGRAELEEALWPRRSDACICWNEVMPTSRRLSR